MHHIEFQTETGVKMQEILQRGGAVPEEMVARMIEDKINSPEVAHHGKNCETCITNFVT